MKIYTSPGSSTSSSSTHSQSLPPAPSSLSPIDLVVASPRSAMDHHHRSAPSAGSAGSASPYPVHAHNPFTSPFRLPLDTRLPHPTSLSPFPRPPSFDLDLINDYRLRPQFLGRPATGLEPPAFHHSPFDRARTHMSPALESPYDYYSMRLKQLASSPVATVAAKAQFSSAQPPTPGVAATPTSTKPESPCVEPSAAGSPRGVNSASLSSPGLALPPKLKSCEFCGKSFRFQSNLVVHRRSHTGEKPFRCPMCPHACTQQSKLKRHMKTHSMKPDGSTSPSDAAAAEKADDDDDEDEEEEEEEEEMEDEEEMIEEEMNEEEREVLERMKASKAAEEGAEPGEIRHDAKRIKLEHNGETKVEPEEVEEEEEEQPSDLSMKPKASSKPVESLLSEVMKNSGLTSIQTYNEAFQAALAESQVNGKDKAAEERAGSVKSGLSHDGEDTPRSASPKSPHPAAAKREKDGDKESDKSNQKEHVFLGATDLLSKGLKRDAAGTPTSWPSSVDSLVSGGMDPVAASAAYSRLHHPWLYPDNPVRLFFPGYPPRFPPHARDLSLSAEGHNGLSLSPSVSTASSALKSSSDSPSIPALFKPGLSSPPSFPTHHARHGTSGSSSSSPTSNLLLPSNGGGTPRKENRRNDTCEYCGKVFKNCSNLTVHRRSHTGEKPYKCSLCSYACAQSSKLTRHMKTHGRLGKDVYTCKFCQMPFSVPSTLEKHMRKCVENRNARLLAADAGDLSSEASNGEVNRSTDSTTGVF
ncbi:B-cell lymphoma/leukemia 11A [Aplysia californica]|uniref:B-cell lymphoma/leukemia 11A n=1 Tax=Aplysia californica TaxID=6500 RepID=A0ABM1A7V2_APLCA|nr:B-cell lymphoma/leukemia 11A [Aplysia californica]